jgi:hypothetical protein
MYDRYRSPVRSRSHVRCRSRRSHRSRSPIVRQSRSPDRHTNISMVTVQPSIFHCLPERNILTLSSSKPIPKFSDEVVQDGEPSCLICMSNKPAIAPICGHLSLCGDCSNTLFKSISAKCPVCRGPFTDLRRIFNSPYEPAFLRDGSNCLQRLGAFAFASPEPSHQPSPRLPTGLLLESPLDSHLEVPETVFPHSSLRSSAFPLEAGESRSPPPRSPIHLWELLAFLVSAFLTSFVAGVASTPLPHLSTPPLVPVFLFVAWTVVAKVVIQARVGVVVNTAESAPLSSERPRFRSTSQLPRPES